MSDIPFARLFSMPTFEGLRVLRASMSKWPNRSLECHIEIVKKTDVNASSYDLAAAVVLNEIVAKDAPFWGVGFYRVCLRDVLLRELPEWVKLITLGRGRFIKRLKAEDYRDIRSLFRQAKLLDEPPSSDDIEWWDDLQGRVRLHQDAEKLKRARDAELLSLEHERQKLQRLGILLEPRWMAIEDNTVGYDVLSYSPGEFGPLNRLIEVKSTIASPIRFFLTRNEWEQALEVGSAYVFHVWDMQKSPPVLYEKTVDQVLPHVPTDSGKGRWANALIPVEV